MGSTRLARRAGRKQAKSAMKARAIVAMAKAGRSSAPNIIEDGLQCMACGDGANEPENNADANEQRAATEDETKNIIACGTEGHSNPEFACALRDAKRHDPVKADAGENKRETGKYSQQCHDQSPRSKTASNITLHRCD